MCKKACRGCPTWVQPLVAGNRQRPTWVQPQKRGNANVHFSIVVFLAPARNTPHNRRAEGTSPVDQRSEHSSTQSSSRGGNRDVHKGVPGGSRWVSPAFSRDTFTNPFSHVVPVSLHRLLSRSQTTASSHHVVHHAFRLPLHVFIH